MNLLDMFERPEWQLQAACRGSGAKDWFPAIDDRIDALKQMCATCPVSRECLDYALRFDEAGGIWGGTAWVDRRKLRAHPVEPRNMNAYGAPLIDALMAAGF